MPQNKRSLKWHDCSCVPRNEARCVVSSRTTSRNRNAVGEATGRSDQMFATIHSERDWVLVFPRIRVEFDLHGIGVDIVEKNLNVK